MATALARRSATGICYLFRDNSNLLPKSHVSSLLQLFYFSSSSSNPKESRLEKPTFVPEFFIDKYQFSHELASKVASASARTRNPENADLLLSFLKDKGFSNTQLEKIMSMEPGLVSSSVEKTIKPNFKMYEDFGFSAEEVVQMISSNTRIMCMGASSMIARISILKGLLGQSELVKVCKNRYCFSHHPEKSLLPNIELLKTCGVSVEQINNLVCTFPSFFFVNPDTMRKYVQKVDEIGVDRSSKSFIYAVRVVGSMSDESWELKLKTFRDLGFSEDDILRVLRVVPTVFAVSTHKLKKVKEFLLETGKYDMSCIVNAPLSLISSVEKRYKPRFKVLNALEKKGLLKRWPRLSSIRGWSNEAFFKKFVAPYGDEVREAFIGKVPVSHKAETGICDHKQS